MSKLTLVEPRTADTAWYRTADGRFDVMGWDLSTNNAAGRAAGAGAVWSWRPAKPSNAWSDDMHHFAGKAACVADLMLTHYGVTVPPPTPPTPKPSPSRYVFQTRVPVGRPNVQPSTPRINWKDWK